MSTYRHLSGFKQTVLLSAALLVISGCAISEKNQCLSNDWALIGQSDGAAGRISSQRLSAHSNACGKHGIQPDQSSYLGGYANGLKTYCTVENGYNIGSEYSQYKRRPHGYEDVCPDDLELSYLKGYMEGLQLDLNKLEKKLAKKERKMESQESLSTVMSVLSIFDILDFSDAEEQEDRVNRTESEIGPIDLAIRDITSEIEKWMIAVPELKN